MFTAGEDERDEVDNQSVQLYSVLGCFSNTLRELSA